MSRPLKTDLDCQGKSRVKNLPAPLAAGDAVTLRHLNEAIADLLVGQLPQVISEDLTITGTSVMFRSVDISDGITVTVEPGSQWVVYL